jgi:hypothetical protein
MDIILKSNNNVNQNFILRVENAEKKHNDSPSASLKPQTTASEKTKFQKEKLGKIKINIFEDHASNYHYDFKILKSKTGTKNNLKFSYFNNSLENRLNSVQNGLFNAEKIKNINPNDDVRCQNILSKRNNYESSEKLEKQKNKISDMLFIKNDNNVRKNDNNLEDRVLNKNYFSIENYYEKDIQNKKGKLSKIKIILILF